jgi:adenylate cyclase
MARDDHLSLSGSSPSLAVPRDVRLAVAYMRRALTQRITATELAQLCGAPERTLHRHFLAFLGHAPLVQFRRMRLAAVREALLSPGESSASVTETATRFGFTHLGRFAGEYRRRFGETPSATLARGHAASVKGETGRDADRAGYPTIDGQSDGWLPYPARRRDAPSITVLGFRTDGGGLELQGFGESLAEHLAAALGQVHGFAVRLVHRPLGERDARAPVARYCVAGQVVHSPKGTVRVVLRLCDLSAGDRHLWGDTYDGTIGDLLGLQDRVVDATVRAVRPGIEAAEIECARRRPADDLRARDLVLRALPFVLAADPGSAMRALGPLEEAMHLDPDDPRPAALAAWCHTQLMLYDATDNYTAECVRTRQLADRAAALDPLGDPLVLTARGGVAMGTKRREEADTLLSRARAIDPGFGWAWERGGWLLANSGQSKAALDHFRRAMPLKGPRAPIANCLAGIGAAHCGAARFEEAALWTRRALAENPGAVWLNRVLAPCYLALGQRQAAAASVEQFRRAYPGITLARVMAVLPGNCEGGWGGEAERRVLDGLAALGMPS